jgi:hypothetical protein
MMKSNATTLDLDSDSLFQTLVERFGFRQYGDVARQAAHVPQLDEPGAGGPDIEGGVS